MRRITSRVKVSTGPKCNAKCKFCYYWDNLKCENPTTSLIEEKLRYARSRGILDIDFSGGEPTIRSDLPRLVSYAKSIGFRDICVITNGIKLSDSNEVQKLVNSGLTGLLCSIEGDTATLHEKIVGVPDSFTKVLNTIRNGIRAGLRVRTNTTVISYNFKRIVSLAKVLRDLKLDAINFIMFNSWCSAEDLAKEMICKYSDAAPYLKRAIAETQESIPKVVVRYIPFCFMIGCESHVCNLLQKSLDPDEWDDATKMELLGTVSQKVVKDGKLFSWYKDDLQFATFRDVLRLRKRAFYHDREIRRMLNDYHFSKQCAFCRYHLICDGISSAYKKIIGFEELKPVSGNTIIDYDLFLKNKQLSNVKVATRVKYD